MWHGYSSYIVYINAVLPDLMSISVECMNEDCPTYSAVLVGKTETLSCGKTGKTDSKYTWSYSGLKSVEHNSQILSRDYNLAPLYENGNKFSIDKFNGLPRLRLINATLNDAGQYVCDEIEKGRDMRRSTTHLTVLDMQIHNILLQYNYHV